MAEEKKILIVDDEDDILKVLEARLSAKGFAVITAQNGILGLKAAKEQKPDLIISDVLMPEMDGFTLYKELKDDEATKDIPVLILTARNKMEDTFRMVGAHDFIPKPFDIDVLIKKVNDFFVSAVSPTADTPQAKKAPQAPKQPEAQAPEDVIREIVIVAHSKDITRRMSLTLQKRECKVRSEADHQNLVSAAEQAHPRCIVLEVLIEDSVPKDEIKKLRKHRGLKDTPIVLFGHIDKEKIGEGSIQQRRMAIENAKTACMEAGATEYLGMYEDDTFLQVLDKYITR